jgi:hypothetical protein
VATLDTTVGEQQSTLSSIHVHTDEQVSWLLHVLATGLSLIHTGEYDTARQCVQVVGRVRLRPPVWMQVYSSWLTCLTTQPHASVPAALRRAPIDYTRRILQQLPLLFAPVHVHVQSAIPKASISPQTLDLSSQQLSASTNRRDRKDKLQRSEVSTLSVLKETDGETTTSCSSK